MVVVSHRKDDGSGVDGGGEPLCLDDVDLSTRSKRDQSALKNREWIKQDGKMPQINFTCKNLL